MPRGARYFVDGYNVLLRLKLGEGGPLEERRAELVARVAAAGLAAWIGFDSRESVHGRDVPRPRRVEVAFARPGQSADDLLIEQLRRAPDLSGAVVVSDDREVRGRAGFLGARTLSAAEFGRMLAPAAPRTPRKERPLTRAEVDEWLEWFGFGTGEAKPRKQES